jgi:hypothetical protein
MSEYKQIKEILHFFERIISDTDIKYKIACGLCNKKNEKVFTNVWDAEKWIDDNQYEEILVGFSVEGLKPINKKSTKEAIFEGNMKIVSRLEKLRALAKHTPYEEEADTAIRMIHDLEKKLGL